MRPVPGISVSTPGGDRLVEAAPAVAAAAMFRRFWPDTSGVRAGLAVGLGLVMLGPLTAAAQTWLFKVLVDRVLIPRDASQFPSLAVAYVGVTALGGAVAFTNQYLAAYNGENFLYRLRNRVFAHLHTLPASFFDRRRLGDVLSRLTTDIVAIETLVLSGVVSAFSALFQSVLFLVVLIVLDWRLALVSFLVLPPFWLMSRLFAPRIKARSRDSRGRLGAIASVAQESLSNVSLVQAYGRQDRELARFSEQNAASVRAALSATRIGASYGPLVDLIEVVGVLAIVGVGVWQLSTNQITLGELLAFLLFLAQLYGPVRGLSQLSNTVYAAAASAERIVELLDQRPLVTSPADPVPLPVAVGAISLRDVSFGYPGTSREVLTGLSFDLPPGSTTALVGLSGAGKSTVSVLLARLHDPTHGVITLDGHDLRRLDLDQLRRHIALVPQETMLFDGTIAENIRDGRPDATEVEVASAARAAGADRFIAALPEGMRTRVGQRGRMLSGGQRQRIALARALIRDAAVLVLDEPATGLDAQASELLFDHLFAAARTTLLITHDLGLARRADHIVYLAGGRVVEAGTATELVARDGPYARLHRLQSGPPPDLVPARHAPRSGPPVSPEI